MPKEGWKKPKNKTEWLADLIEVSEAAVKGYEKYLLNKIDYLEMAKLMKRLRDMLPMDIDDKFDKGA
jgi:hypothetical protein